jgi:hypothetical protein
MRLHPGYSPAKRDSARDPQRCLKNQSLERNVNKLTVIPGETRNQAQAVAK